MRPHGNLRLGEVRPIQRTADEQRFSFRFAVQYLRTLRAAARPDWKPGRGIFACGAPSGGTSFLYFVANTQGGHFFSSTLEEHNRNVLKYRRLLEGLPADPPPPPPAPAKGKKKHANSAAHAKPAAHSQRQHKGKAQ